MKILKKIKNLKKVLKFYLQNYEYFHSFSETKSLKTNTLNSISIYPLFVDTYWYKNSNFWEPSVLMALKKIVKPGDSVMDVGANFGGITSAMSRLVGPNGKVVSFEASPRIIANLQQNIVLQGCNNVFVYNYIVCDENNENIPVYNGTHLNDTIFEEFSSNKIISGYVKTITLDKFCEINNFYPRIIKFDIEGSEYKAIKGFGKTIDKVNPIIILEQTPSDDRCFSFLIQKKYKCINLANYRSIENNMQFREINPISNLLFFKEEINISYNLNFKEKLKIKSEDIQLDQKGKFKQKIFLKEGVYLIYLLSKKKDYSNFKNINIKIDLNNLKNNNLIFRYHGSVSILSSSYDELVFFIDKNDNYEFSIHTDNEQFVDIKFNDMEILEAEELNSEKKLINWP